MLIDYVCGSTLVRAKNSPAWKQQGSTQTVIPRGLNKFKVDFLSKIAIAVEARPTTTVDMPGKILEANYYCT